MMQHMSRGYVESGGHEVKWVPKWAQKCFSILSLDSNEDKNWLMLLVG